MMRKTDRNIRDIISSIIAYAVLSGPIVILIIMMVCSFYGRVRSRVDDTSFHLPFDKKVYYTKDDEYYHHSKDCPLLQGSDRVYSAYKDELPEKRTPCEQCAGRNR